MLTQADPELVSPCGVCLLGCSIVPNIGYMAIRVEDCAIALANSVASSDGVAGGRDRERRATVVTIANSTIIIGDNNVHNPVTGRSAPITTKYYVVQNCNHARHAEGIYLGRGNLLELICEKVAGMINVDRQPLVDARVRRARDLDHARYLWRAYHGQAGRPPPVFDHRADIDI